MLLQTAPEVPTRFAMDGWRRVSLLGPAGTLRAPGELADELRQGTGSCLLADHAFGRVVPYARLVCHHMAGLARPWAVESDLALARARDPLRPARRSGSQAALIGLEPDRPLPDAPSLRAAAVD